MITLGAHSAEILIGGKPVKQYGHNGHTFIEARAGTQYEIRVRNSSPQRVLAVVSVDGIDVISGEAADDKSGGYIIPAYGSYTIKGFRVSNEKVNAFEFAKKEESYAAKSDAKGVSMANCGVIGVRIFNEKYKPTVYRSRPPYRTDDDYYPAVPRPTVTPSWGDDIPKGYKMSARGIDASAGDMHMMRCMSFSEQDTSSADAFRLGTKFSEQEIADKVSTTTFERDSMSANYDIFYATRDALISMGVPVDKTVNVALPQSFKETGYCKPPRKV